MYVMAEGWLHSQPKHVELTGDSPHVSIKIATKPMTLARTYKNTRYTDLLAKRLINLS